MATIINESTSVVQVDSSGLQNGQVNIVYVSTTSVPAQLVTVIDATGFTSSPQAILLSTTGGAEFSDGTSTTSIRQRFGYVTLESEGTTRWSIVNSASFSNPTVANSCKSLNSGIVNTYLAQISGGVSTGTTATRRITGSNGSLTDTVYASTLYVNSVSSFLASRPGDYTATLVGNEYVSGPVFVTGATSYRGSISTSGNLFTIGNISSKLGIIYVGGDVTVGGSIRGQRGVQMAVQNMDIYTSSVFAGQVGIQSTVVCGNILNARNITTSTTEAYTMNIMSSIIFTDSYQSIRNTPNGLELIGVSATIPSSISTVWLTASNSLTTSNVSLRAFGSVSTLQYLTLGSAAITNADGSVIVSSIGASVASFNQGVNTKSVETGTALSLQNIRMNDADPSGEFHIPFGGTTYDVSGYWMISSTGTNGTFSAPYASLSTLRTLSDWASARVVDTVHEDIFASRGGHVAVGQSLIINGLSNASLKRVFLNNSRGSITGSQTETAQEIHCSSILTDSVSTAAPMQFINPVSVQLQETFISTVMSGTSVTSSLTASQITSGFPVYYSTINPSTPWLLTSSFNMNTGPFMATKGLGTYFDEAIFVAYNNQTTYYSIVNPNAQGEQFLSSPYVNSIAGTGSPGLVTNGQPATSASLGTEIAKVATDSDGNVYIGTKDLGWKIQKISASTNTITTIAGNYRYFYGDGQFPLSAAFGPRLALSVSPQGQVIITDISNVRIRALTTDPIVQTIAGTGVTSYSGDGGPAYLATFSSPTCTATDLSGNLYVADTGNRILRIIQGSTITTYAGTPGVQGSAGDGGPALSATLTAPFGLATDLSNNVYFTDTSNCVIRQVSRLSTIALIAGTYTSGFGGDGGPAINATLSTPRGITVDSSRNIYVCDTGNARVRRINANTQTIQTIAGNGTNAYGGDGGLAVNASLSTPTGVAVDAQGNVYISDTGNQCIRFVNMTNNRITTVAGRPRQVGNSGDNSFASFATLNSPTHIALDLNSGYYYIADEGNSRVRYVDPMMRIIYPSAGNGSPFYTGDGGNATAAVFGGIKCLTAGSNDLYIVDDAAHIIRSINLTTGLISAVAGTGVPGFSGEGGLATLARISSPQAIVVDSNATLYFTDRDNQRVRRIVSGTISTLAGTGVAEYNGDSISSIRASLNNPTALAIDSANQGLYVGDLNNNRIRRISPLNESSLITTYAGSGLYGAPVSGQSFASTLLASTTALAVDSGGQVYFTDLLTNAVWKLNNATNTLNSMSLLSTPAYLGDAGPLSNAYFNAPTGLSVDGSGNFLIADQGNFRVRRTYTYGYPQIPVYLTMNFNYTNYYASTGVANLSLNGNSLATFYGSNETNGTYQLTNANIYNYPLQGSNPVYGDQTPYITISQTETFGYTKLDGSISVQQVPSQALLTNSVNSNAGITMNAGTVTFPHQINGITIDNRFNDISLRTLQYSGQLLTTSDPALKEHVESADTAICYSTLAQTPLKRYKYVEPYLSTFHTRDRYRLGFLTTDISPMFPKSVQTQESLWDSEFNTLDTSQIKTAQYGVTQHLIGLVSTLESEVDILTRILLAQRNTIL